MVFYLLLPVATSYSAVFQFAHNDLFVKFPSFGFQKGGTFLIRLLSYNLTGIRPYFLPIEYDTPLSGASLRFSDFCNGTFSPPPALSPASPDADTWEGTIDQAITILPFVTNCAGGRATVTIRILNPHTALDSRELYLPDLYFTFVFVYAIVAFVFILNQFTNLHFSVSIHTGISCAAVLKTISCYLFAQLWTTKGATDDFPLRHRLLAESAFIAAHTVLITFNGLAIVGIGTYRDHLAFEDFLTLSLMSAWFFFTAAVIHCTTHIGLVIGLFLLNGIDLYLYTACIYHNLMNALRLEELFLPADEPIMLLRLDMVIRFGGYITVWAAIVAVVTIYVWVVPTWTFLAQLLEELCIFALFCIDVAVFFYRDGFRTAGHPEDMPCVMQEPNVEEKVIWVTEPDQSYFGYLAAPSFAT
jgi:hypothetical protein